VYDPSSILIGCLAGRYTGDAAKSSALETASRVAFEDTTLSNGDNGKLGSSVMEAQHRSSSTPPKSTALTSAGAAADGVASIADVTSPPEAGTSTTSTSPRSRLPPVESGVPSHCDSYHQSRFAQRDPRVIRPSCFLTNGVTSLTASASTLVRLSDDSYSPNCSHGNSFPTASDVDTPEASPFPSSANVEPETAAVRGSNKILPPVSPGSNEDVAISSARVAMIAASNAFESSSEAASKQLQSDSCATVLRQPPQHNSPMRLPGSSAIKQVPPPGQGSKSDSTYVDSQNLV
jgi:hypothetical protein